MSMTKTKDLAHFSFLDFAKQWLWVRVGVCEKSAGTHLTVEGSLPEIRKTAKATPAKERKFGFAPKACSSVTTKSAEASFEK